MKRLLLFLLILASICSAQVEHGGLTIPGDGAIQIVRKSGAGIIPPPLDGLVDVWVWDKRVSAATWPGDINNKNFVSNAGSMNTASQAITFSKSGTNYVDGVAYDDLAIFAIHKLDPPLVQHAFASVIIGGTQEADCQFYPVNEGFAWSDKSTSWANLILKIPAVWGPWDEIHLYVPSSGTSYIEQNGTRTDGLTRTRTALGSARMYFWSGALGSNGASGLVKCLAIYNGPIDDEKKQKIWEYLRQRGGTPL